LHKNLSATTRKLDSGLASSPFHPAIFRMLRLPTFFLSNHVAHVNIVGNKIFFHGLMWPLSTP
jgi:hypothetical protein